MIYFDHAATTMPKPPEVIYAVQKAMEKQGSLGRSGHGAARLAAETAFQCRLAAGEMFDIQPEQVVFTFNTTHGLNIAIKSLVKSGDRVVVSGFEHNAVVRPLYAVGADVVIAGSNLFDPGETIQAFASAITPDTKAVICTHVSNVFGYILPIEEIAMICRDREVPLVIDAAQSAGILPLSVKKINPAFVAMPGHKGLFGPQGTGLLLCNTMPHPLLEGGTGSQSLLQKMPTFLPDIAEAGTQNMHGIAGLLEGLKIVKKHSLTQIAAHERFLLRHIANALSQNDRLRVYYAGGEAQIGVLSLTCRDISCETLADRMAQMDIAVRAGYHCAPLAHKSAGTLGTGTLRISVSAFSTMEEAEQLISFFMS